MAGTKDKKVALSQKQLAQLGAIMGRSRLAAKAGLQFGGRRDTFQVAGYLKDGEVTFGHYWALYKRGDIAGRIVDMPAKTTWRLPPEVTEDDHDEGTTFTKKFDALAKRVQLWRRLERADRLAGVGRYAVLFIGTRDGSDETQLKNPLTRLSRPEDILFLQAYHEENAEIQTWETDPRTERFGQPLLYKLRTTSDANAKTFGRTANLVVHWTRVLHIAEDLLEDEVYGRPRLERTLNRLFDLEKISASVGEAYWQHVVRILQATIDPDAEIADDDLKALDEKLAEMVHDLRRQFWGQGVQLSWLGTDVPPVKDIGDHYFSLIAGASGIPKRILFGSEMGELASTTDQQTYFGMISERQEQFAEPVLLRAFIDRMLKLGALPAPTTKDYTVVWPPLFEESDDTQASANLKRAQTAQALTPVGGDPRELVEVDEDRNVWLLPQTPAEAKKLKKENEEAAEDMLDAVQPPGAVPEVTPAAPTGDQPGNEPDPSARTEEEDDDDQPAA